MNNFIPVVSRNTYSTQAQMIQAMWCPTSHLPTGTILMKGARWVIREKWAGASPFGPRPRSGYDALLRIGLRWLRHNPRAAKIKTRTPIPDGLYSCLGELLALALIERENNRFPGEFSYSENHLYNALAYVDTSKYDTYELKMFTELHGDYIPCPIFVVQNQIWYLDQLNKEQLLAFKGLYKEWAIDTGIDRSEINI